MSFQLLEAKRLIDQHTNVATTLLDVIKQRKLDTLFELEQKILQRANLGLFNIFHQIKFFRQTGYRPFERIGSF